ncbi:HNH endonuclease signature motif containing protein [Herbaspirillum aquaticum]|uniref:HNH endonuclease signature motif containing protein n=1 Tax=Herbaspirillum aquaticum TaxID=568783 RepID=UPI003D7907E8
MLARSSFSCEEWRMDSGEGLARPRVLVISETCQEFQGRRYYRCGKYFQDSSASDERRLHRAVWIAYHGAIPDGHHIHHLDGNRANNQPENLLCMLGEEHCREHGVEQAERLSAMGKIYQTRTKAWHASEEGRKWHAEHYQKNADKLHKRHEAECSCCGKKFMAVSGKKNSGVKFCSKACKAHARRQSGIDDVDRICGKCGATFTANKYAVRKYCHTCFPGRRTRGVLPDRP